MQFFNREVVFPLFNKGQNKLYPLIYRDIAVVDLSNETVKGTFICGVNQ